ncbi:BTB/POZ domain-containing protein At3g22104-like [Curcuma longa]|uniref:BTB/POZ domain-containing protein At3g22104-like n=1 Tax=Curcuma longa TaxID=136217 RepID=UPI003D9E5E9B
MRCDLEVDVDGEETFLVDKEVLSSFCGRLRNLSNKALTASPTKPLKVAITGFPGGSEAFELMAKFCYNNGRAQMITSHSTCLLHSVAHFMDMSDGVSASTNNLLELTEKSLEGLPYWSWPEIMHALKQCQDTFSVSVSSGLLDRVMESVVGRITAVADASPSGSSPESSALRLSVDSRSTISTKNSSHRAWWFQDILSLSPDMIKKIISSMVLQKVDHVLVSKFLMHYLKNTVSSSSCNKKRAAEISIELLYSLDGGSSVSCKGLFDVLRVSASLKLSKGCQIKLESMIGRKFDHATLDSLLIPAPAGMDCLYDVSLILRFLKCFLSTSIVRESIARLKQAAKLMDSYLAEIAPDFSLKPLMFVSLATALPDEARDSHDSIYRAIDMYLEVHTQLLEEEKTKLFCAINYEKLSSESCKHLAKNSKFPSRTVIRALVSQQRKLRSLLQETNQLKEPSPERNQSKKKQLSDDQQVILYAKKLEICSENKRLKSQLQGMQWKVTELEKICKKMQAQMEKAMKMRRVSPSGSKSLPRLCS